MSVEHRSFSREDALHFPNEGEVRVSPTQFQVWRVSLATYGTPKAWELGIVGLESITEANFIDEPDSLFFRADGETGPPPMHTVPPALHIFSCVREFQTLFSPVGCVFCPKATSTCSTGRLDRIP